MRERVRARLARVAGAYELRARAVLLCCLPATISLVLLGTVPGVARPAWVLPVRLLAAALGAVVVVTLVRRRMSTLEVGLFTVFAQGIFVVLALGLADAQLREVMALAVLVPPLFVGIVAGPRQVLAQVSLAVVCAVALTWHMAEPGPSALPRVLCVVLVVACPSGIVVVMRYQLDDAVRSAERSAVTDPLTGLLNRRGLTEALPGLAEGVLARRALLSVLVLDVDHFKAVNDQHGHLSGDEVLRALARTVQAACRAGDLVVRLGGEEVLVLARVAAPEEGVGLAERIRRDVEGTTAGVAVTVSVGVATGPLAPEGVVRSVELLLAEADERMYGAKRGGRNRVQATAPAPGAPVPEAPGPQSPAPTRSSTSSRTRAASA